MTPTWTREVNLLSTAWVYGPSWRIVRFNGERFYRIDYETKTYGRSPTLEQAKMVVEKTAAT